MVPFYDSTLLFTLRIITRVLRHRNSRTKPILIFKLQHVHALSIFLLTFPFFRAILVFLFYKIDQRLLPYHFFFVLFFPRPWSIARGVIRLKYSRQRYTRYVSGFSLQKFRNIAIDTRCLYFWFLVYPSLPPPCFPTDLRSRILGPVLKIHTDETIDRTILWKVRVS